MTIHFLQKILFRLPEAMLQVFGKKGRVQNDLYLIRHGRQNSSDCNVNVPLADAGIKQAELLGKRLRNYSIDAVYCSDLIRAKQTAEIAFSHNEFLLDHLQVRSGLAEIDFGDLTGIPDAQVKSFTQTIINNNSIYLSKNAPIDKVNNRYQSIPLLNMSVISLYR